MLQKYHPFDRKTKIRKRQRFCFKKKNLVLRVQRENYISISKTPITFHFAQAMGLTYSLKHYDKILSYIKHLLATSQGLLKIEYMG